MPTSGHESSAADGERHAGETGLLELAGLSLEDLSHLDDSVVAGVIRNLMRRQCGTGDGERFNNFNAAT